MVHCPFHQQAPLRTCGMLPSSAWSQHLFPLQESLLSTLLLLDGERKLQNAKAASFSLCSGLWPLVMVEEHFLGMGTSRGSAPAPDRGHQGREELLLEYLAKGLCDLFFIFHLVNLSMSRGILWSQKTVPQAPEKNAGSYTELTSPTKLGKLVFL